MTSTLSTMTPIIGGVAPEDACVRCGWEELRCKCCSHECGGSLESAIFGGVIYENPRSVLNHIFKRMTEIERKEAIDHWKWLGAKTQAESRAYMEKMGIRKYVRRFNKCLYHIDKKCLCGQMDGVIKFCEFRKGEKRCEKCKVGGDFFPWDEEDLKLISKLDLEECYDLDF